MNGLYNNDYAAFKNMRQRSHLGNIEFHVDNMFQSRCHPGSTIFSIAKDYELSTSSLSLQNQDHQAVYMNPEQTFHTPSFGDEEFDIPQLSLHQGMAAHDANVAASMAYHHHHQQAAAQSLQHSHSMAEMAMAQNQANFVNAGNQMMGGAPYQQQPMYMVPMKPEDEPIRHESYNLGGGQPTYTVSMNPQHNLVIRAQHPQQQPPPPPPPQHVLGGHIAVSTSSPTAGQQGGLLTTISQSQLTSQLGVHFNMGQPPSTGSPRSNQTSPGQETSEDSDDNVHHLGHMMRGLGGKRPSPEPVGNGSKTGGSVKKAKVPKKKKKRDPNEPQKPVSAYALFFRDTQAAIKGQNPNASFGEVSKIVASMWDSLDEDHKNVYKKRTEAAKKEYLKALAAYRASLVSKSASEHADSMYGTPSFGATPTSSTSPPSSSPSTAVTSSYVATTHYGSSPTVSSSTGILGSNGAVCGGGVGGSPPQELSPLQKKSPLLTSLMEGGSPQGQPVSPPHSGAPQQVMGSPPNVLHSSPMQPGQPPSVGMMQPLSHSMAPQPQQQSSQVPPASPLQPASYQAIGMIPNPQASPNQGQGVVGGQPPAQLVNYDRQPTCLRNGCPNPAMESPEWDNEYCSNDCVGRFHGLGGFTPNLQLLCFRQVNPMVAPEPLQPFPTPW